MTSSTTHETPNHEDSKKAASEPVNRPFSKRPLGASVAGAIGHFDLPVEDITCGHCATRVEEGLKTVNGVLGVNVDLDAKIAYVDYDPNKVSLEDLFEAVRESGYTPGPLTARLSVEGMRCLSCVAHIEGALEDVPGVVSASVDLGQATVTIIYRPESVDVRSFVSVIEKTGYRVAAPSSRSGS